MRRALLSVLRLQAIEKKAHDTLVRLNETQNSVLEMNQRLANLELHNAGMHAALTNLLLKNEALLQEIDQSLRNQTVLLKQNAIDKVHGGGAHQINQHAQDGGPGGLPKSGPTT